jgi:cell wall-associated NlpC family hydrolase
MMAALAVWSTACATTQAVPRPFPGATTVATDPAGTIPAPDAPAAAEHTELIPPVTPNLPGDASGGHAIADFAMGFRGVPYRSGGTDPAGFDCSGLVQYVFAQYGVAVPRLVEQQYEFGDKIDPSDIKPGDLIFFNTKWWGHGASHVAISIGGDSFVHAPNSTGVVRVETLGSSYWGSRYVGARRVNGNLDVANSRFAAPARPID